MRTHAPATRMLRLLSAALVLSLAGCTTVVRQGPGAGVVAQLSLERFLQASAQRDLEGMARLFGSEGGAEWDTGSTFGCAFKKIGSWFGGSSCVKKRDVEVRMDAIARILQHQDYRITREETVAGRLGRATRIYANLTVAGQTVSDVPFVMVRTGGGQWLVEQIDLERVMAGTRVRRNNAPGGR
ncbi:MAG: hypothetical protein AMXMBFR53_29670 [Gemmatimonadota bacterium]